MLIDVLRPFARLGKLKRVFNVASRNIMGLTGFGVSQHVSQDRLCLLVASERKPPDQVLLRLGILLQVPGADG